MAIQLLADDTGSNSLEYLRLHKEETGGLLGRHANLSHLVSQIDTLHSTNVVRD